MENNPLVSIVIPTHNRKEKLEKLVDSVLRSNYPKDKLEIIVVDDASIDGTREMANQKFPNVKVIRNKKELFLAGSRNAGIKNGKGSHFFLIDDDNVVDRNCIPRLVEVMEKENSSPLIGIVAPIMYYLRQPSRVWCAGTRRNMLTSLTTFVARDRVNRGQFEELIESQDFPNAFMIKREVIEKVGAVDEIRFPIHYDEADLGERVRRAGYRIVCNPEAEVWHDTPLPEEVQDRSRSFHVHSKFRAYCAARNRITFHKEYSEWWQFLLFVLIFNWLVTLYYLKVILLDSNKPSRDRLWLAEAYLRGLLEGLG
jgi:GT2 family glycosyltransferase